MKRKIRKKYRNLVSRKIFNSHRMDGIAGVVESYRKHGDLSRLPMKDLDHWAFNYL
jgi:hypothetical protein